MPPIQREEDLTPFMAMHSDLKATLQQGMAGLQIEMQALNVTQVGVAKDVEHIKDAQEKHEAELSLIRNTQLRCPSSTGFRGTMKRISKLERFRDRALESGVLKTRDTPVPSPAPSSEITDRNVLSPVVTNPKFFMALLLGAAVGGCLLTLALFLQ